MNAFLTPFSSIEPELAEMQSFLETPSAGDQLESLTERLSTLSQHMARSGKLKADAEYYYHQQYNGAVMSAIKQLAETQMSTSTLNEYIKALCREQKILVTWADRVNRSATHQIDAIRTLISYAKMERERTY